MSGSWFYHAVLAIKYYHTYEAYIALLTSAYHIKCMQLLTQVANTSSTVLVALLIKVSFQQDKLDLLSDPTLIDRIETVTFHILSDNVLCDNIILH